MIIVTHNGTFHADETMAIAVYELAFGVNTFDLIRTRDEKVIAAADYVFDVGNIYDPSMNRFDHHMPNPPLRDTGEIYSSAGLAWKHFGEKAISILLTEDYTASEIISIFNKVDKQIFIPIDLIDNGEYFPKNALTISHIIGNMNPAWNDGTFESIAFNKAVDLCKHALINNIKSIASDIDAVYEIKNINTRTFDDQVLILSKKMPFVRAVYSLNLDDVKFVILPDGDNYLISTVTNNDDPTGMRLPFPKEWAGLRNSDLEKVNGVPESIFCHNNLFVAGASSLVAAKNMAFIALQKRN